MKKDEEGRWTMGFPQALMAALRGRMISRLGWNGKGQYVECCRIPCYVRPDGKEKKLVGDRAFVFHSQDGTVQVGWLASQGDMLADDWTVLDAGAGNEEEA